MSQASAFLILHSELWVCSILASQMQSISMEGRSSMLLHKGIVTPPVSAVGVDVISPERWTGMVGPLQWHMSQEATQFGGKMAFDRI